jgi:hypothetical protein
MLDGDALRGSEYNRGTGCLNRARPGLCGGRRAIGVPTAEVSVSLLYNAELRRTLDFNLCSSDCASTDFFQPDRRIVFTQLAFDHVGLVYFRLELDVSFHLIHRVGKSKDRSPYSVRPTNLRVVGRAGISRPRTWGVMFIPRPRFT